MPGGSGKKRSGGSDSAQNSSNSSVHNVLTSGSSKARKRKRCEVKISGSDIGSDLEDINVEDAIAIERKLRNVAKDNDLSDEEMRRLLQKFVKNEHILALVTLKAEEAVARERQQSEQPAIIITDTPSVPKLTRAKARELNKSLGINVSTLIESKEPEIAALIQDELHSDEDDEEYVFKEDDFVSDDDPNTTASDIDSNPCTPQTPLPQAETEDSPVKFTDDGCFKIPLEKPKGTGEDVRIAARTRSKLCLQQKAIEDIESEFVPPDVERIDFQDFDLTANDEDWMQFLNDFTKPLNSSFITDDDDTVNDPEYIAAEKIPEDAEELRDINIPKNELSDLVAEIFEGLMNEGVSLENFELDTQQKCLETHLEQSTITDGKNHSASAGKLAAALDVDKVGCEERTHVTRQLNFDTPKQQHEYELAQPLQLQQAFPTDVPPLVPINNMANVTQNDCSFHPNVMSTPSVNTVNRLDETPTHLQVPVGYTGSPEQGASQVVTLPATNFNTEPEWVAFKIPGQENSYQLARVVSSADVLGPPPLVRIEPQKAPNQPKPHPPPPPENTDPRYSVPYDTNFTWEYISIKRHVYTEYLTKFENLRNIHSNPPQVEELPNNAVGFTKHQHDILQQQLRIHVQMLTQTFIQSYSHPNYWKLSTKAKDMLTEVEQRAENDASFRAWNLKPAMKLITQWEEELKNDTPENKEMMKFIHHEIKETNSNCRQIPRFPPRIMDLILNSKVFMYPQYLPRIPFTSRPSRYQMFSPAETQLIAMGLERHIKRIHETGERIHKKTTDVKTAVLRLAKDTIFGKSPRRVWAQVKSLRKADFYNPVKYYFDHKRAPPVEHQIITFENNKVLSPKQRYNELPLAWQTHITEKRAGNRKRGVRASKAAGVSYLEFVREALGEDIQLPNSTAKPATPDGSTANLSYTGNTIFNHKTRSRRSFANSVTINVNYHFSSVTPVGEAVQTNNTSALKLPVSSLSSQDTLNTATLRCTPLPSTPPLASSSLLSFNYDWGTKTLQSFVEPKEAAEQANSLNQQGPAKPVTQRQINLASVRRKLHFSRRRARNRYSRYSDRRASRTIARHQRPRRQLRKLFISLQNAYRSTLKQRELRYKRAPVVLQVYRYFKALELYTNLLSALKMACRNATTADAGTTANESVVTNNAATSAQTSSPSKFFVNSSQQIFGKRMRTQIAQQQALDDESNVGLRSKKASRKEENFKHMLLPDSADDANRKDAIYAFNFYEKVEEAFKSSNRAEDCKKFNYILKMFDPRRDKVVDLYNKLEQLFLPEHPELAQVFLTFLLPSEAAEIGRFFEHFMINNMTSFINKLNIYFNKQPAQIRKIYNCLAELAEDPEVTFQKVESKILPLLKGNQFLIDWFLQQFSEAKPPERIFSTPEQVNLKEVEMGPNMCESLSNPRDTTTPCCELQQQHQQQNQAQNCQLRYINGRIFYGNKMTLPAKLSFMASNYQPNSANECDNDDLAEQLVPECVHGIREHGEKRLAAAADKAAANAAADCSSDDNEKSEEEEVSKAFIIDTTNEEEISSSMETCDDATLRAHAMRLNPSYYSNTCFPPVTSTPNTISNHTPHLTNAKKSILNFNDDGKVVSPRKHPTPGGTCTNANTSGSTSTQCLSPNAGAAASVVSLNTTHTQGANNPASSSDTLVQQIRDRRKSPTKKVKSPVAATRARPNCDQMQPMVVVYEKSSAIACAKKLHSMISKEENDSDIDNKDRLSIVAGVKRPSASIVELAEGNDSKATQTEEKRVTSSHTPPLLTVTKVEPSDNSNDMEFLPESAEVGHTFQQACVETIAQPQDVAKDISADITVLTTQPPKVADPNATNDNYTADCKLDIVATLAGSMTEATTPKSNEIRTSAQTPTAWTREEDKLILIEMKLSAGKEQHQLFECMRNKLPARTLAEIEGRYNFLMEFLYKLQGK